MDQRLQERLTKWHECIEALAEIEHQFLQLEADEEPLWNSIFLSATGKNVAEKEAAAWTHPDWRIFSSGLVSAKTEYNKSRRILELKQAAFNAEYLNSKLEGEAVQKYPRNG